MAKQINNNDANLGFEAELFRAADKLRGNMEPSDYKHVALGLIFLKHISDSFEAKHAELLAEYPEGGEDPDEYAAENVFWVPKESRWSYLQASAKQPGIGKLIDEAMLAIEKVNPSLKGVLPKDYARPALNAVMLGELIDLISGIAMGEGRRRLQSCSVSLGSGLFERWPLEQRPGDLLRLRVDGREGDVGRRLVGLLGGAGIAARFLSHGSWAQFHVVGAC